ncbi:hypothetical protein [Algibacter sp. L4_22]|uniref:hypothetical protein n=1 Tax=Algibacter sp. L4_22 TaxID=2942477 RepID=UPI00201B4EF8|nr:hypothetical protein [Algibacter sp. L4_22]
MIKKLLTILLLLISYISNAQHDNIDVKYFTSTNDYTNNKISNEIVSLKIRDKGDKFIEVKKILNKNTGKKSKKAGFPWAIKHDSITYFNLRYCKDYISPETFVKSDLSGQYLAIFLNKSSQKDINSQNNYYGVGLQGLLISESTKWGGSWKSKDGTKSKILIVNTKKLDLNHIRGYKNSGWRLLTKRSINDILNLELTKEEIKLLTTEKIEELIKINNG